MASKIVSKLIGRKQHCGLKDFAEGPPEENSFLYSSQIIEHEGTSDGDPNPHVSSNVCLKQPAMEIEDLTPTPKVGPV
ncbi:unnamed protein product [Timema podura]|uniref:Uncharacterized protein n=1 Tax=Timema podura TaxID=61482 RepID=A0ABN7PAM9_TIMPD|nr:unnamed protein product [Timema podura]